METLNEPLMAALLGYIDSNKQVIASNQKNRKRYNLLIATGFLTLAMMAGIMIYIQRQSVLQYRFVLEHIDNLNKTVDNRRRFLNEDQQRVSTNLEMTVEVLRYNDSVKRRDDSIQNVQYKRAMKH